MRPGATGGFESLGRLGTLPLPPDIQLMKPLLLCLLLSACPVTALGEISLDLVLGVLRKQSVAANSGDIGGLVAAVPGKGFELLRKGQDEGVTLRKAEMAAHFERFFKTIEPGTYLYGVRLCSVDKREADSLTVTLEVQESYRLKDADEVTTSSYRESVVLGLEDGKVVFLRALMDEPNVGKLALPRP